MGVRSYLPGSFPERGAGNGSAARVAVREFFPVLLVLAAVDVSTDGRLLKTVTVVPNLGETVPAMVYVYAFLGAGAYAVTSLAFNPKESIVETYRLTYRMVGALPLAAGVYLLSRQLGVGPTETSVPLVGVVFLSGLYVRLTLRRLGDLAERLYGAAGTNEGEEHRRVAGENARQSWRYVATGDLPEADRREAVATLERVEAITGDDDATRQELERARELSEETRQLLAAGSDGDDGDPPTDAGPGETPDDGTRSPDDGPTPGD
jgi:hypothetical protein